MVMAVLFTIRFWEISDYSNRAEVREWLKNYVADGWWRRGGLYVAKYMAQGYLTLALVCYIIWLIANQFGPRSLPEARIIGAALAAFASVVFIVWVLGFVGIKFTESAFERYVSQNVSYTSSIILKRVLKAKTDMGFVLMCLLYMPVVYTLLQSLIGMIIVSV